MKSPDLNYCNRSFFDLTRLICKVPMGLVEKFFLNRNPIISHFFNANLLYSEGFFHLCENTLFLVIPRLQRLNT